MFSFESDACLLVADGTSGGREYSAILFLFKGYESSLFTLFRALSFLSGKRVLFSAHPLKRVSFVLLNKFAFFESAAEKRTEKLSGDKFTGKHGKDDKPKSVGKSVSVFKDERDYNGICDNRRNRVQPHAF